jgi:hypothetical protein
MEAARTAFGYDKIDLLSESAARTAIIYSSTTNRPVPWATSNSRLSGRGVPAAPGTTMPSPLATAELARYVRPDTRLTKVCSSSGVFSIL